MAAFEERLILQSTEKISKANGGTAPQTIKHFGARYFVKSKAKQTCSYGNIPIDVLLKQAIVVLHEVMLHMTLNLFSFRARSIDRAYQQREAAPSKGNPFPYHIWIAGFVRSVHQVGVEAPTFSRLMPPFSKALVRSRAGFRDERAAHEGVPCPMEVAEVISD